MTSFLGTDPWGVASSYQIRFRAGWRVIDSLMNIPIDQPILYVCTSRCPTLYPLVVLLHYLQSSSLHDMCRFYCPIAMEMHPSFGVCVR